MSRAFILFTTSLALLSACRNDEPQKAPYTTGGYGLERFSSCDDVRDYVSEAFLDSLMSGWYGWGYDYAMEGDKGDDASEDGDSGDSGPTDYSETNVQELGVDEPDIVKTDGDYVYYVQDQTLYIVDSWPADETNLVASLDFEGWPSSMFLRGDTLALFTYEYNENYDYGGDRPDDGTNVDEPDTGWSGGDDTGWSGGGDDPDASGDTPAAPPADFKSYSYARISIIDVSDRSAPEIVRQVDIDGSMVDARMIEGDLYVVTDTWLEMPWDLYEALWDDSLDLPEVDWDASDEEIEAARDQAREILQPIVDEAVASMDMADLLPLFRDGVPGEDAESQELLGCTDLYRPEHSSYPSTLAMVHLNLDETGTVGTGSDVSATGVMSYGWTVYASEDHLYIAQPSYSWYWGWGEYDDTKIGRAHV